MINSMYFLRKLGSIPKIGSICLLNVAMFLPDLKKIKFVFDLMYSSPN